MARFRNGLSIGDIYEAAASDDAWAALPDTAARMVGARSCILYQLDGAGNFLNASHSYFNTQFMADLSARHPGGRDVWVETGMGTGIVNRAVAVDSLLPESVFLASPLWNDVIRRNGDDTGRSMGTIHRLEGDTLVASFQRAFGAGAFGHTETALVDAIATDLHRAHRIRNILGAQSGRIARLEAMLSGETVRALLLGPNLTLIEASPDARALLNRGDGLMLRAGRVQAVDSICAAALREAVERTIRRHDTIPGTLFCPRADGRNPWRVLVLPAPDAIGRACLVVIRGGDQPGDRVAAWLTQRHGATAAEVAVAQALLAGETPSQIGERRGVSLNTVRTQIKHLLEKTDARTVSQMLVLLSILG